MRLGLCCLFYRETIRFRTTTASRLSRLAPVDRGALLAEICGHNTRSLGAALRYCIAHGVGAFRISSDLLPLATHPQYGYDLPDLPDGESIRRELEECGRLARQAGLRTSFHPDQFVVLNSPRADVAASSRAELLHHLRLAELTGADVINIHGGGAYGERRAALDRLAAAVETLPAALREKLTLENDDRVYPPADLLPLCRRLGLGFVYDVHHHRCLPDGVSVEETTGQAAATWNREPLFHVSSPRDGWTAADPRKHALFLDPADFPACWLGQDLTVDVEAKAKEEAVLALHDALFPAR